MRNIALAMAAVAAMAVATPSLAQDRDWRGDNWRHEDGWRGRDHRGPGVTLRLGRPDRAYARDCSMRVTRVHRSDGTVVTRRERRCD